MAVAQNVELLDQTGCPSGLAPGETADAGVVDPAPFVRRGEDGVSTLELSVQGAKCGGCIAKIEGGLKELPGVEAARLNLSTGKLALRWRGAAFAPIEITRKLNALGYRAAPYDPEAAEADYDAYGKQLLRSLAVAAFATANIMLLSIAVWAGGEEMGPATRELFHWISAAIATPAALYAGRPFFSSALGALRKRRANMDVPISLAVLLALGVSAAETLQGGREAYFDAAVMLLFFLLIGRWLDHRLRARARAAARELLAMQTVAANRLTADGQLVATPAADIAPGDRIVLFPGDRAPVNGVVIEGESEADNSLVTGESAAVGVKPGDRIYAGLLNITSKLVVEATAAARDSLVADLARLIEAGEQTRNRYVRLADKAAALYVPVVHSLAAATFLGWLTIGGAGLREAIMNASAVLIITCPCALGLAAPAVFVVATGRLFRAGVLVKSGDALERLARATHVVFDKTGTLTLGAPRLLNRADIPEAEWRAAAELARASRHPLARAIVAEAGAGAVARDAVETPGAGVEGTVGGARARLGRRDWAAGEAADGSEAPEGPSSASELWFRLGDAEPIRLQFEDRLRADARETIAGLKARGLTIEMISGDREGPARAVAEALGLEEWRYAQRPEDKAERLDALARAGARVLMVGDGLNDAPALAHAFVSMSPASAADASQAAADFTIQGERLAPMLEAIDVARAARMRVLENFGFAAFYNALAVPLAVAGLVTPLIAALAMSGSSVIVTLNALRLARGGRRPAP